MESPETAEEADDSYCTRWCGGSRPADDPPRGGFFCWRSRRTHEFLGVERSL